MLKPWPILMVQKQSQVGMAVTIMQTRVAALKNILSRSCNSINVTRLDVCHHVFYPVPSKKHL